MFTRCQALDCHHLLLPREPGRRGRAPRFCCDGCYLRTWKQGGVQRVKAARKARRGRRLLPPEGIPTECGNPDCRRPLPPPAPGRKAKQFCSTACYQHVWGLSRKAPKAGPYRPAEIAEEVATARHHAQLVTRAAKVLLEEELPIELLLERFEHLGVRREEILRAAHRATNPDGRARGAHQRTRRSTPPPSPGNSVGHTPPLSASPL